MGAESSVKYRDVPLPSLAETFGPKIPPRVPPSAPAKPRIANTNTEVFNIS